MAEALVAGVALLSGVVVGWIARGFVLRPVLAAAEARLTAIEQQLSNKTEAYDALVAAQAGQAERLREESARRAAAETRAARVDELEAALSDCRHGSALHQSRIAELETRIAEERRAAAEKIGLVDRAQVALSDAFKALSAEALASNNQSFLALAQATLQKFQQSAQNDLESRRKAVDELVQPIRESLTKVDGKLGEIEKVRISAYAALNEQVRGLVETHLPMLRNETANLVKALRQPTVRGRWGEIQLRRVVEMAGMLGHCDFVEQESRTTEEGRLRPDMVVRLPAGRQIVVDAKAPIAAYLNAIEAADDVVREAGLVDHARQVRDHMVALGRKAYWEQFDPTPEFVVMFLPGEMFFSAALQHDPGLIEFGVNERVIPATPTTLIALLRAVAYGWRQEALAKNAQEVADLGKQLYERIAKLAEHWTNVGDKLGKAVEAYNNATSTLETRVLVSARRLRDLKAAREGAEIEVIEPVERMVRTAVAPELLVSVN